MPNCLHCSANIPGGRTYCHPHYLEALRQHDQQVAACHDAMERWSRLTPDARAIKDRQAEEGELSAMACLVAALAGAYVWYQVNALFPIDGLWGLLIMLCTGLVMLSWSPARHVTGKVARAAFVALPSLIYSLIGLGALSLMSDVVRGHALPLLFGILALVIGSSLIKEWNGQHRASGMPIQPLEPRP